METLLKRFKLQVGFTFFVSIIFLSLNNLGFSQVVSGEVNPFKVDTTKFILPVSGSTFKTGIAIQPVFNSDRLIKKSSENDVGAPVPFVEFSIPIKIWEPLNDNEDYGSFNWGGFSNDFQLWILFENIQEIYDEGIPINLALWDAPDWIVVNPDSSKNRELLDGMTNELVESICAFIVHLRDKYNVDVKSVSINPRKTNWANLVLTGKQKDNIKKEADRRFKELELATEFRIGPIAPEPQLNAKALPTDFALEQNYPNPFNPETKIEYQLSEIGKVTLEIYDLTGRKVKTLLSREQSAGSYSIMWDGTNDSGKKVSTGVYLCRIQIESTTRLFIDHKKMTFCK